MNTCSNFSERFDQFCWKISLDQKCTKRVLDRKAGSITSIKIKDKNNCSNNSKYIDHSSLQKKKTKQYLEIKACGLPHFASPLGGAV